MKKFIVFAVILTAGTSTTFVSCSGWMRGGAADGETMSTVGWIDDDTYRISAEGDPGQSLEDIGERKERAKRAAVMNAQYYITEKFKNSKIDGRSGMENFEMTGLTVARELKAIIKRGSVYKVNWDDAQNCEIIYEVKAKDLKKKVSGADWKLDKNSTK